MRILITIPTWNEARIIEQTLDAVFRAAVLLHEHEFTIEVADNASTDGTADIVRSYINREPSYQLRATSYELLSLSQKGKGLAIRTSWSRHLDDMDVLVFTDADLAADISSLSDLIQPILNGEADIVCGSRFVEGSKVERRASREFTSRLYRTLQRLILGLPVQDAQCGFKAISVQMARLILPKCRENGWMFDSELLALATVEKARIREIPITWIEQRYLQRRVSLNILKDGWGFLLGLARIKSRIFCHSLEKGNPKNKTDLTD